MYLRVHQVIKTFNSTYSFYYCTWLDQPSETTGFSRRLFVVVGLDSRFGVFYWPLTPVLHKTSKTISLKSLKVLLIFRGLFPQPFLDYEAHPLHVVSHSWDVLIIKLKIKTTCELSVGSVQRTAVFWNWGSVFLKNLITLLPNCMMLLVTRQYFLFQNISIDWTGIFWVLNTWAVFNFCKICGEQSEKMTFLLALPVSVDCTRIRNTNFLLGAVTIDTFMASEVKANFDKIKQSKILHTCYQLVLICWNEAYCLCASVRWSF